METKFKLNIVLWRVMLISEDTSDTSGSHLINSSRMMKQNTFDFCIRRLKSSNNVNAPSIDALFQMLREFGRVEKINDSIIAVNIDEKMLLLEAEHVHHYITVKPGLSIRVRRSNISAFPIQRETNSIFTLAERGMLIESLFRRMEIIRGRLYIPADDGSESYVNDQHDEVSVDSDPDAEKMIRFESLLENGDLDLVLLFQNKNLALRDWLPAYDWPDPRKKQFGLDVAKGYLMNLYQLMGQKPPLLRILKLVGIEVADYFHFLTMYQDSLRPLAVIGLVMGFFSGSVSSALYSLTIILSMSVFIRSYLRSKNLFDYVHRGPPPREPTLPGYKPLEETVTRRFTRERLSVESETNAKAEEEATALKVQLMNFLLFVVPAMAISLLLNLAFIFMMELLRDQLSAGKQLFAAFEGDEWKEPFGFISKADSRLIDENLHKASESLGHNRIISSIVNNTVHVLSRIKDQLTVPGSESMISGHSEKTFHFPDNRMEQLRLFANSVLSPEIEHLKSLLLLPFPSISHKAGIIASIGSRWFDTILRAFFRVLQIPFVQYVPQILTPIGIGLLSSLNRALVTRVSRLQNPRTFSERANSSVSKLALLSVSTQFGSIFYIAFIKRDLHLVKTSLLSIVLVQQIIRHVKDRVVPFLSMKFHPDKVPTSLPSDLIDTVTAPRSSGVDPTLASSNSSTAPVASTEIITTPQFPSLTTSEYVSSSSPTISPSIIRSSHSGFNDKYSKLPEKSTVKGDDYNDEFISRTSLSHSNQPVSTISNSVQTSQQESSTFMMRWKKIQPDLNKILRRLLRHLKASLRAFPPAVEDNTSANDSVDRTRVDRQLDFSDNSALTPDSVGSREQSSLDRTPTSAMLVHRQPSAPETSTPGSRKKSVSVKKNSIEVRRGNASKFQILQYRMKRVLKDFSSFFKNAKILLNCLKAPPSASTNTPSFSTRVKEYLRLLKFRFTELRLNISARSTSSTPSPSLLHRILVLFRPTSQYSLVSIEEECELPPFETFDEMTEIFIQFSCFVLFAAVCTWGPALALANGYLERLTDGWKLVYRSRRPSVVAVSSLEAWTGAFSLVLWLSCLSNAVLIGLDYGSRKESSEALSTGIIAAVAIVFEHVCVAIKAIVDSQLPTVPQIVTDGRASSEKRVSSYLRSIGILS